MVAYLCSRDNRVTRLERDGHSWAAHPVLDGVSATCVATDGGRVLSVTALGRTIADAQRRAYQAMGMIHFDGMHYRRDIGWRAIR